MLREKREVKGREGWKLIGMDVGDNGNGERKVSYL
jgi:hypothetical protein